MQQHRRRVHVIIRGRVQGVYFRASAAREAQNLGLVGWVKNCLDGSVEILAEGAESQLEELIVWCRHGPPGARVEDLSVHWQSATGEFTAFGITR